MTNQLSLRALDIPQLHRFGVGFDRMFDQVDEMLRAHAQHNTNYPPYNMIKHTEDKYSVEIAVAGFSEGDITITVEENVLKIEGKQAEQTDDAREFVYRGISGRDFVRTFTLAEHVEVVGASQENGILTINLERIVPEDKKPKSIAIIYNK